MPKLLRQVKKETLEELYVNQKLSLQRIAEMENISAAGVLKLMQKYGIKTRTISEARTGKKHSEETKRKMSEAKKFARS